MKFKIINTFKIGFIFLLLFTACEDFETDLDIENQNAPDDKTLLTDAVALEAIASGLMNKWFHSTHDQWPPGSALSVTSDNFTCSWGNFNMRDLSSEPRVEFNNTPSYGFAFMYNGYFSNMHSILANSNNLIIALNNGVDFGDNGERNKMIEAVARFGQGLSTGYLSLLFDRVWLSDETGALNDGNYVSYSEGFAKALEFLDMGISVADANSFSLPADWIPGDTYTNADLSKLMNSFAARFLVYGVRNSSQRDGTDWNNVLDYSNNGLTRDFAPLMDDVVWWDDLKWTLAYDGMGRIDMYTVNLMDPNTIDYWPDGLTTIPESTSADSRLISDFAYLTSQDFIPDRGQYHFSSYRHSRYDEYITFWDTPSPDFLRAENESFKAEAMLRMGNLSGAAAILNDPTNPRKARGNLSDVPEDAEAIADAIHYERFIECANTGMGISFFEMRKENLLQTGTLLHFPVPGSVLETAGIPYYTFGGTTGIAGEDYSIGGWR